MKAASKYIILFFHTAIWLSLFLISVSIQYNFYGLKNAVFTALMNLSSIMILFYFHFFLINQFFEKRKYFTYGFILIVVTVGFTLLRIYFNEFIVVFPLEQIVLDGTLSIWLFGVSTAVLALIMSFLYQMIKNRYEREKHHLNIINQQNEAKIQYLKAQINPHFLFNSLNNIYSLSVVKSDQTPKMVLKLSSLLRYAIYEGEKEKVSLSKEVEQIQEFIDLFKMRLEHHPNIIFEIEGKIEGIHIEPMLLIPLVENCFKHGGFENNESAFAEIKLKLLNKKLHFSTKNLIDNNIQKDKVGGVGLTNIQKRLDANYGMNYKFKTQEINNCFLVVLEINY